MAPGWTDRQKSSVLHFSSELEPRDAVGVLIAFFAEGPLSCLNSTHRLMTVTARALCERATSSWSSFSSFSCHGVDWAGHRSPFETGPTDIMPMTLPGLDRSGLQEDHIETPGS